MYFKDIQIGRHFTCNGNLCLKKSTMTAEIVAYKKTYYYEKLETVKEARYADARDGIYARVPIEIAERLVIKHGGIKDNSTKELK